MPNEPLFLAAKLYGSLEVTLNDNTTNMSNRNNEQNRTGDFFAMLVLQRLDGAACSASALRERFPLRRSPSKPEPEDANSAYRKQLSELMKPPSLDNEQARPSMEFGSFIEAIDSAIQAKRIDVGEIRSLWRDQSTPYEERWARVQEIRGRGPFLQNVTEPCLKDIAADFENDYQNFTKRAILEIRETDPNKANAYIEEALSITGVSLAWKEELRGMKSVPTPKEKKPKAKKSGVSINIGGNVGQVIPKQTIKGGQHVTFGNTTHIHGDQVQGDKFQGDKIQGDKIVHNYTKEKSDG